MVIDRGDQIVNLCEMKCTDEPFSITKKYAAELTNKISVLKKAIKKRRGVYVVMITENGLRENEYSNRLVQRSLTLEDLF